MKQVNPKILVIDDDPRLRDLLVRYLTAAKQRGGSLKLLNPSKFALQTLKLVRVVNLFEIFEDQQLAVASFQ